MFIGDVFCPNCSHIWGTEEVDWQQCDSCGYPLNEENNEDYDHEFDDEIYD